MDSPLFYANLLPNLGITNLMKYMRFIFRQRDLHAYIAKFFLAAFVIFQAAVVFAQVPVSTPKPAEPEKPPPVWMSKESDEKGNLKEYRYLKTVGITAFNTEANKLGKLGYRLENIAVASQTAAVISAPPPDRFKYLELAAVFRLDKPNTYEYDWFEADKPGEIVTRINKRAESGFYYRDGIFATDNTGCSDGSDVSDDALDKLIHAGASFLCWSEGGVYFMERKVGEASKREYRVHIGKFGWGKNPTAELQAALDNSGQLGFRPVALGKMKEGMNYAFYTLVEKDKGVAGEPLKARYAFLKSEFSFAKKVNAMAKEGYRIRFGGMFGAYENVLLEKTEGAAPTAYRWVDASGKSHEKELSEVMNAGARFALMNREAEDLIFEDTPGLKYEYKILRMAPDVIKPTKKNPNPPAAKTQDEIFSEFDALLGEGYVIRDVFYSAGTKILFERKK